MNPTKAKSKSEPCLKELTFVMVFEDVFFGLVRFRMGSSGMKSWTSFHSNLCGFTKTEQK